jgi:large subunit ribosomal protein L4
MSKLTVYDLSGASVGEVEVSDTLLDTRRGKQAVHDVIVAVGAGRRAGTASTKTKGDVAGSNKKPWRQKGTGRARTGYRQSPVWRGGGVAFGPHPRAFGVKVNRKVQKLALRRALADRVADGGLKVVETLALPEARTRVFVDTMKALGVTAPALFVVDDADRNAALAARNIPGVALVPARELGVYDLVRYPAVVMTRAALNILSRRLGEGTAGAV